VLKVIFFDLHGTLGYTENPVTPIEVSKILTSRGYEVSPQAWRAAIHFVGIVDFPRLKLNDISSFLKQVCCRLGIEVDKDTLDKLIGLFESRDFYKLYPEAIDAVKIAKEELNLKAAIVTTIPKFKFKLILKFLSRYIDFVMTGLEAGCDKSNPKMYLSLLKTLKIAPKDVVVIGDEAYVDIILPKSLGMKVIQLIRGNTKKCDLADAHVNNLIDAIKVIKKWMKEAKQIEWQDI